MMVAYSQPAELAKVRRPRSLFRTVRCRGTPAPRDDDPPSGAKAFPRRSQSEQVIGALRRPSGVSLRRTEFVGPWVGEELVHGGLMALGMVVLGIVVYLALRFEWKFGIAAIIANLHDVVIILGFFAFFQWEFSLSVLAAVLAVLGYSVNESVVILTGFERRSVVIAR